MQSGEKCLKHIFAPILFVVCSSFFFAVATAGSCFTFLPQVKTSRLTLTHTSPHLYLLRACECVYYHKDFEHRLTHTYTQGRRDGCIFKQHMRYFHFRPTCVCVCVSSHKVMALCLICIANRRNFAKCLPIRETICFIYLHLTLISLCHPQPSSDSFRRRADVGPSFLCLKKY